ncbi:MAG: type II toxin-antitoxin system RelE/ParE family toxin [Planctomycetes bacterium]|nr:type II toxin-antitoxin system RelE/ParE family toxin [Planctomycetota bacterium]
MQIEFASSRLAKSFADDRSRTRAFGANRAQALGRRLSALLAATNLEQLRNTPGRWHELKGDRKRQLAADLDGPYRLILEPVIDDASRAAHANGLVWSLITHVRILDITNYHD